MLLTWAATFVAFCFGVHNSDNKIIAGLFLSWTSDVLFFSVVTVLLSLISSAPPTLESFEERASILFQGKEGSQVDYARSLLNRLGNYSEQTHTIITIDKDEEGWFRLRAKTTTKLRNLIEDVRTTYELQVVDREQRENPPGKIGEVVSFTLDGKDQIPLGGELGREPMYSVEIGGESVRDLEILIDRWIGPGGYTAHSPARFTKRFTLEIINMLDHTVFVKLEQPKMTIVTLAGRSRREELLTLTDIEPLKPAYEFYLFRSKEEFREWRASRARR